MITKHTRSLTLSILLAPSLAQAVTVSVSVSPARCNLNNGTITASANGGVPPYSYQWSTGATAQTIQDLAPGDYTVTVTDGLNNTDQTTATVEAVFAMGPGGTAIQMQPDCQGMCTGIAAAYTPYGGTLPYTYPPGVIEGGGSFGELTIMGICGPSFGTITVWDANGCPGEIDITGVIMQGEPASITVQTTSPACEGQSNGSMTILMDGPFASVMQVVRIGGGYDQLHGPAWNVPYTITDLPAGDYELVSSILGNGGSGGPLCSSTFTGSVPELPAPCGAVNGRVYHDADQDCSFNGFDLGLPYRVLSIEPGNQFVITDGTGNYQRNLDFGTYTIAQGTTANEDPLCPVSGSADFTLDATTPAITNDFANLSTVAHDLTVSIIGGNARPGFATQVWFTVTNNSAFPSGSVAIALSYDNLLLNTSSSAWNIPVIAPYTSQHFQFTALVPADVGLLGAILNYGVTVTNSLSEVNTANNTAFLDVTITGSYDPNDKRGWTSSRSSPDQYFLDQDEHVDYTVRFQNTGTAAAETVVIRDTLDTDLDITTLQIHGASHAFVPSFGDSRELVFTFNDINLPDSTTDLLGSQGYVSYRIKPKGDIVIGDVIENTAGIYFDFNPPIITNTVTHGVDFSTGQAQMQGQEPFGLMPNPASDVLNVIVATGTSSIDILTIDGRNVQAPSTRRMDVFQLDVRALPAGLYYVRTDVGTARFVKE